MAEKPGLALIIAAAKRKGSSRGDPMRDGEGHDDEEIGKAGDGDGEYEPSPECIDCVRHFFEAGADGDFEGAARALSAANEHIEGGESEPEPKAEVEEEAPKE